MRKRDEYLAGFLEKVSVGLLVAAVVRENTVAGRLVLVVVAFAAIVTGYYLTARGEGDKDDGP